MRRIAMAFLSALLCVLPWAANSQELVRREILALYDSTREPDIVDSRLHRFAEMPLNHLGFIVRLHDVNAQLPDLDTLGTYAGVITWFSDAVPNPASYLAWAREAVERGTRFVVLGDPGGDAAGAYTAAVNAFVSKIGVTFTGEYVGTPYGTALSRRDPSIGFEHDPAGELPPYSVTKRSATDVTALMEVKVPPHHGGGHSTQVAVSPRGGYAAFGYEFYHERPPAHRGQWVLNPFDFFRRAFGGAGHPIPDVTTVSGRRIYFSHVDGDGWNNMAISEAWRGKLSSEVMLEDLIKPFPDLPVTIGLISGDVDARLGGSPEAEDLARKMFALPQVEVGSHTYTHPFNWGFFEPYDREREIELTTPAVPERGLIPYLKAFTAAFGATHRHGDAGSLAKDPPRAFMRDPFDLEQEIAGSLDAATRLAPPGKRATILQWSGNTRPFETAVRATREAGVLNINGGDSRFDAIYPSVAYVPPIGRKVGKELQIYAVNSNENTYTDGWTRDHAAQQQLAQTLANTELPMRLKGMNLYYHTYSAERQASLDALKTILTRVRYARVTPITTSHYAAMANGFFTARIEALGANSWAISDRGAIETVRLDTCPGMTVDLAASRGVLGHTRHAGSLYVALDPAKREAVVALMPIEHVGNSATLPSLADSRWRVSHLERVSCGLRYRAEGFGAGEFNWQGLPRQARYRVAAMVGGRETWSTKVASDDEGKLTYTIPLTAFEPVDISVACDAHSGGP